MKATNYLTTLLPAICMLFLTSVRGQNNYYIYSNVHGGAEPWFTITNTTAMNTVFGDEGTGWFRDYFETADVEEVFSESTCFVFLEGSDAHAIELETFLAANVTVIESWVNQGGSLLLNAAPNEGDNIDFGFSGVTLIYPWYSNFSIAAAPLHPIFSGPYLPAGTEWSGSSFAHAVLYGGGTTPLIVDDIIPSRVVLSELNWGLGKVMFGGLTTNNFHEPETEAANLRANIFAYLSCAPPACSPGVPTGLYADNITTTSAKLYWDAVPTVDKYAVFVYTTDGALVTKKKPVSNSTNIAGLTPGTEYVFRVRSICVEEGTTSAFSDPAFFTTLLRTENPQDGYTSVLIYPNPNNGRFTLSLNSDQVGLFELDVYNSIGQMIYSTDFDMNSGELNYMVDLPDAIPGICHIRITGGGQQLTYPVMIEK